MTYSRSVLRSIALPPSEHPRRYRASTLAWWFWCAERSRHRALNLLPPRPKVEVTHQSAAGTQLHDILFDRLGERPPWEEEFIDKLQEAQDPTLGFVRRYGTAEIYDNITGHPDDFQVSLDGDVSILEHKTTEINPNKPKTLRLIEVYKLPVAEFQLKLYCWIFDNILMHPVMAGYRLARTHAVVYWYVNHKTNEVKYINHYPYTYYPWSVEHDVKMALEAYADKSKIIRPRPWKCKQCPKKHKEICQFYANSKPT